MDKKALEKKCSEAKVWVLPSIVANTGELDGANELLFSANTIVLTEALCDLKGSLRSLSWSPSWSSFCE